MKTLKLLTPVLCFIFLFSNFSYSQSGWQNVNDFLYCNYSDGQYLNTQTGFLISDDIGGVVKTTDGGTTWVQKTSGFGSGYLGFNYIKFFDENTGIVSGEYQTIYKTTNGAESWRKIWNVNESSEVMGTTFINSNTGYTVKRFPDLLMKTTNAGESWYRVGDTLYNTGNMFFINENCGIKMEGYTSNFPVKQTTDGGLTWHLLFYSERNFIQFQKLTDNSFLGLTDSKVYKFTENGAVWEDFFPSRGTSFKNINVINSQKIILSLPDKIYVTQNGGITWEVKNSPSYGFAISYDLQQGTYAGGAGALYKLTNSLNTAADLTANKIKRDLTDINIFDENNLYILADSNYIYKSSNGGINFTKLYLGFSPSSFKFFNMNTGFVTYNNKLCKTIDGGITWDTVYKVSNNVQGEFHWLKGINFLNTSYGFLEHSMAGMQHGGTTLMKTSDNGSGWTNFGTLYSSSCYGASCSGNSMNDFQMKSENTGYYISYGWYSTHFGGTTESYALMKSTNGGTNWISINANLNSTNIYKINFINENTGFAIIDSMKFVKTLNGGGTWTLVSNIGNIGYDLTMLDELNGFIKDDRKIYRTFNGGITWEMQPIIISSFSTISKVSFFNPQLGYAIGSKGSVFKTTTGGSTFINNTGSQISEGYKLSQNYPNPFNPETKIQFSIPKNAQIKIIVYDLLGREVKELVNEFKQQGSYAISFNGANLSSGIYFYKLITDDFIDTKKMILVK